MLARGRPSSFTGSCQVHSSYSMGEYPLRVLVSRRSIVSTNCSEVVPSLERLPPVPTLQTGNLPLHTFLGFNPEQHILAISARNPSDEKEIPPNGKDFVSTHCVRGVRKVRTYYTYNLALQPILTQTPPEFSFLPRHGNHTLFPANPISSSPSRTTH